MKERAQKRFVNSRIWNVIYPTFRSVILAGVYDVKNLRGKIRPEYEADYKIGMNVDEMAGLLFDKRLTDQLVRI